MTGQSKGSPKRDRIREYILDLIETRPSGAALPSERQLCAELSVSRPTVRGAVDDLVRDGLLERRHGQGMFVARAKIAQDLDGPAVSRMRMAAVDGTWTSRTVEFAHVSAGARIGRRLRISPRAPVVRAVRLRLVDDEPLAIDTLYVPDDVAPGLTAEDLERHSFYRLLDTRFGHTVAEAVQVLEPTVADEDEAALLGVPPYAPMLLMEQVTEDRAGRVVEFTRAVYRGDRYRIVSKLHLGPYEERGRVLSGQWSTSATLP